MSKPGKGLFDGVIQSTIPRMNAPRPWMVHVLVVFLLGSVVRADLAGDIREILQDRYMQRIDAGVVVIALGDSTRQDALLFEHQPGKPLIPASNLKLVTTGAALALLKPDFRFRTALVARPSNDGGFEVAIVGDGDPTLGDLKLLEGTGWDATTVFRTWADSLRKSGITRVSRLVVDDSVFDRQFFHPSWPVDQENLHYCAQVGGLNLNANTVWFDVQPGVPGQPPTWSVKPATGYVSVRNAAVTSSKNAVWFSRDRGTNQLGLRGECSEPVLDLRVTIHDPPMFAGKVALETFRAAGIEVADPPQRTDDVRSQLKDNVGNWRVIAIHETPLVQVLTRTNKDSVNMYAESLCKRMGFASTGRSGSWTSGTAAMASYLQSLGVAATQFKLDDGCGLSRKNAISAGAIARVLADSFHGAASKAYVGSLAVGGMDGTLDNRFSGALRGRVFAKSGYINQVSGLSGYLRAGDGRWYAFSILMNDVPSGTNGTAKEMQERIVQAIDANARR